MQKQKRIEVTKRDIKLGWSDGSVGCPISRAIQRAIKIRDTHVFIDSVIIRGVECPLPNEAALFSTAQTYFLELLQKFDNNGEEWRKANTETDALRILKPFSFVLKYDDGGK